MIRVLFVCTGNICRSPTAEGVFAAELVRQGLDDGVATDSAGTHAYHVGEPPDQRSIQAARLRGYDIEHLRARQVRPSDFERFDLILAMDSGHLRQLRGQCPSEYQDRIRLFLDFAPETGVKNMPDPYYGGPQGFEHVLDLVEAGVRGLITHLKTEP